jgi:hypothetical protein
MVIVENLWCADNSRDGRRVNDGRAATIVAYRSAVGIVRLWPVGLLTASHLAVATT